MDASFGQVVRALRDGASGPEAFAVLLRLLSCHFDCVDSGADYKKLYTFGVPSGNPFCDFSREFRIVGSVATGTVVSVATGTERVLAPGTEIVLEVVRMAVHEQYPRLMPMLYPAEMATELSLIHI